ncbi:A24 family peptidase [Mechercharimyces sp. CAU 1602]|uniref:prepilin peptidase n=1 Tax=Mechercharimyces sp. CAU 1602 TaxID=2973933 RepID=UPI002162255F|nr:A24 family peptidase [Mechercharimyces sp. CAU 1602]MCS1351441.1 A24 family peptidase [Mechercharimyces sp. CAU 1602]
MILMVGSSMMVSYYTTSIYELVISLCFVTFLMTCVCTDCWSGFIPNRLTASGLLVLISVRLLYPESTWGSYLLGMLAGFCIIVIIIVLSDGGMGWGDAKMMGVAGFAIGWPSITVAIMTAVICGGLWSIYLMIGSVHEAPRTIPFAPHLAAGSLLAYIWGEFLLQAYWRLLVG